MCGGEKEVFVERGYGVWGRDGCGVTKDVGMREDGERADLFGGIGCALLAGSE